MRAFSAASYSVGAVGLNCTSMSGCCSSNTGMIFSSQIAWSSTRQLSMVTVVAASAPPQQANVAAASVVRRNGTRMDGSPRAGGRALSAAPVRPTLAPAGGPLQSRRMRTSDLDRAVPCVAVDGGASGCRAAVFGADGTRRAGLRIDRHASLSLDPVEAAATVRACFEGMREATGLYPGLVVEGVPVRLVAGLAGALRPERRDAFRAALGLDATIVTDGEAQLLGATGGAPGACLAVGTGSVVHWRDASGASGMAGGWGFPVGDEGSAAWLGLTLLRRYLDARDRGVGGTALFESLEAVTGSDVAALQAWTTSSRSTAFGGLASIVTEHAARGDRTAAHVLAAGAACCERLFDIAPDGLPRHLVGGLAGVYAPLLEARGVSLTPARGDALDGLARLARSLPD